MKETTYYKLKKPQDNDNVLISDLNGNADAVDTALHALDEGVKGAREAWPLHPRSRAWPMGTGWWSLTAPPAIAPGGCCGPRWWPPWASCLHL